MKTVLFTAPTLTPVSLLELKEHLRIDSGTLDDNVTVSQSLAYASHAIANNYTTHLGAAVDVLGKEAIVVMNHGENGATGTVDTKIQDSHDNVVWADWATFTQVTTANDNANYKKEYTGGKQYIKTVSKVLLAACVFGSSVIIKAATATDDDYLNACLETAIDHAEDFTGRQIMEATWDVYLDKFPDVIELPFGNLLSVTHLKYTDAAGTQTTMTENTDYIVETNGEGFGRIVLPDGKSWPSFTPFPSNPITIRIVCGWEAAADVPYKIKAAILLIAESLYNRLGAESKPAESMLYSKKLWRF